MKKQLHNLIPLLFLNVCIHSLILGQVDTLSTFPTTIYGALSQGISFELTTTQYIHIHDFEIGAKNGAHTFDIYIREGEVQKTPGLAPTIVPDSGWSLFTTVALNTQLSGVPVATGTPMALYLRPGTYGFYIADAVGDFTVAYKSWNNASTDIFINTGGTVTIETGPNKGISGPVPNTYNNDASQFVGGIIYATFPHLNDEISMRSVEIVGTRCPGTNNVAVNLRNFGSTQITTCTINWKANGQLQMPFSFTGLIDTMGGTGSIDQQIIIGSVNVQLDRDMQIEAWTSMPNGKVDPIPINDSASATFHTALSGTYTINPNGTGTTNFKSFNSAVNELKKRGVCGPTIFNVAAGVYSEHISIPPITGASAINTITFQGNIASAELSYACPANVSDSNYVIRLDGASYITFNKLQITSTGTDDKTRVIVFENGAHHNTILNCDLTAPLLTYISRDAAVIISYGESENQYNTIKDNKIYGGSYGIAYQGSSASDLVPGVVVSGNTIEESYYYGAYIIYTDAAQIKYNTISSNSLRTNSYGLRTTGADNGVQIIGNVVKSPGSWPRYGIYISSSDASPLTPGLVANNMVHVGDSLSTAGTAVSLYILGSSYIDVIHNSVVAEGTDPSSSATIVTGTNVNLYNNLFVHYGNGYAIHTDSGSAIIMDYNNLFSTGANLCYFNGGRGPVANLDAWQATGNGLHSLSTDPQFPLLDNLYTQSAALDNRGIPFPEVNFDIDSISRSSMAPDIGANEFSAIRGNCNAFMDYRIDNLTREGFKIDWVPGTGNTSFYMEYGPAGFMPGSGTMITGAIPNAQPPIYINSLQGNTKYDIYIGELCTSGADSSYLDGKWTVKTLPSCPPVQVIHLNYASPDSAIFSFSSRFDLDDVLEYEYEYGLQGFGQGTGTLGNFSNPGGIGGLIPLTYYDIYVRSNCQADGYGTTHWIGPFTFFTDCPEAMSGAYTVDANSSLGNRNFRNFKELTDNLENCGISGPVTVNITQGIYSEQVFLNKIPGISAESTLTIQADPANTSPVEIKHTIAGPGDNYVWRMDSVSYLTLKGIVFTVENHLGYGYGTALDIRGNCSYINIEQNIFISRSNFPGIGGSSPIDRATIRKQGIFDHCSIRHNEIHVEGDGYGIYFEGSSNGLDSYNKIDSNTILGFFTIGISSSFQDNLSLTGNIIAGSGEGRYGISLAEIKYTEVRGNSIYADADGNFTSGMSLYRLEADTSTDPSIITNNMISVFSAPGSGKSYGITIGDCYHVTLAHNSILVSGSPAISSALHVIGDGQATAKSGIKIINNCIVNNAAGLAVQVENSAINAGMISAIDHNNYYGNGLNLGSWGGSTASDLNAWKTLSGQDANSVSGDPVYNNPADLHISSPLLKGAGMAYPLVTSDYDGDPRSAANPDIGADEFELDDCYPSYSLEASAVYHDRTDLEWAAGAGSSHNIEYGPEDYTPGSGTRVSGITGTTYTLSGLSPRTTYNIYIRDLCSTGDTSIWLGPLTIRTKCTNQLSGIYSIDNSQPTGGTNYASFAEAGIDLNECGISDPVTFHVKEGVYTDSLFMEDVKGSSDVNTVTFEPDPSNVNEVMLQKMSRSELNNYVIQFNNTSYAKIKGLTISALDTNYGRVINFRGRNEHINIEDNTLNGISNNLNSDAIAVIINNDLYDNLENSIIKNNIISNGSYGIYLSGVSDGNRGKGNRIEGNIIENYLSYGIYTEYQDNLLIDGNEIISSTMYNRVFGVYSRFTYTSAITDNKVVIKGITNNYGIQLDNCIGTTGTPFIVANNMISTLNNSGSAYGLYLQNSIYMGVRFNSILVSAGSQKGGHSFYMTNSGFNNKILNNSFVNTGPGLAIKVEESSTASINEMNYNNLYASGTNLGNWGGTDAADLAAWQSLSGKDVNSVSGDPFYKASDNLHFFGMNSVLNGAGMPYPSITTDIDGDLRSATAPDIGADEGPDCELSTGLVVDSVSCYNAYLSWTPGLSRAFALVEYDTSGFAIGTGQIVFSDSSLVLYGLEANTTYEVYLSDTCGPDTLAALGPISFTTLPDTTVADFSFTARPATLTDQAVDFDASSSTGAHTYSWNFGDGNSGNGMMVSHSYTANGTYSVQLIVTGDCGKDTITQEVVISGISLEENIISRSLEVFPNPTEDRIQIRFETQNSEEVSIRLSDLSGKVIWENTAKDFNGRYEGEISLEHLAKGTYMLQIRTSGMEAVKRIVKQ